MILNPIMPVVVLVILCVVLIFLALILKTITLKIVSICVIIIMFVVGLRPMIKNDETITYRNNVDVIFVMDNTLSMLAEDYNGNDRRIDAVIDDIEYIITKIPGAYYSLISFGNSSVINLRFTSDAKAAVIAAKTIHQTDAFYARGSTVTIFKDDLKKILESSVKKNERKRVVLILTDGENTTDKKVESLAELKQYVDDGAVLGYGTASGGKMKVDEFNTGEYTYLEDMTGGYPWPDAVSKIDENNLKKMASELGVEYIHMDKQSNINNKINEIKNMATMDEGEPEYFYSDIYYFFCWPLLGLMLIDLVLIKKEYA